MDHSTSRRAVQAGLPRQAEDIVDRHLLGGERGRGATARWTPSLAFADALDGALGLKDYRYVMDFTGGQGLAAQAEVAVDALAFGLSRCVSLGYSGDGLGWDSHADNDATQSALFEGLFSGLGRLFTLLQTTPGESALTLADETVVVVLSEMGRTPRLNATLGKDHWPYTSVLLSGPGLTTGRVIGGFDERYSGLPVDPGTAETVADGPSQRRVLGAGLLELAGVDPRPG